MVDVVDVGTQHDNIGCKIVIETCADVNSINGFQSLWKQAYVCSVEV